MRRSNLGSTALASMVLCALLLVWGATALAERGNDAMGKKLYLTYCFTCHGQDGKGDGYAAKVQPVRPRDLTSAAYMKTRTDEQLFHAISLGSAAFHAFHGPAVMPAWAWWYALTEQQRWDLVAYVRTLHRPPPAGDPSRGAALYADYCWPCHGKTGQGDGPMARVYEPRPHNLTDRAYLAKRTDHDLYHAISQGGPAVTRSAAMPAWGAVLSPQDMWDLVAYIRQLSAPP
jgi:cytochrome c oxidase cbb3-type subunit 3